MKDGLLSKMVFNPWWSFEKRKCAHTSSTKINSTEIKDVSIKKEMIKLPSENVREIHICLTLKSESLSKYDPRSHKREDI